jgi:glutamate-ammonia-ligase adenylyltransferase
LDSDFAPNGSAELAAALRYSHYALRLLERHPGWTATLPVEAGNPFDPREMESSLAGSYADAAALHSALRALRQRVVLRVIARDLAGLADLDEVVSTVTALAEITLSVALAHHDRWLRDLHGVPLSADGEAQTLIVVGMGKLGGGELNVSSDIDLVFVFPEDGETSGPRTISNQEFFDRLGRDLIAAIGATTADGFVFRVDMRLRPYGDPGPLSCSFAFLEQYLLAQGREWERYAWLKGRALTGDKASELEELVRPFVFRKYLDYDAYSSMRGLHKQIRAEVKRRDLYNDMKLGPGGIREIEFIAQVFQLIRGGRDRPLQTKSTREALRLLGERRLLPFPVIAELLAAYDFLRRVEHRLQYRDDQQTQSLPESAEAQEALAASMNLASRAEFAARLEQHRRAVTTHFESIFADSDRGDGEALYERVWRDDIPRDEGAAALAEAGFADATALIERLARVRESRVVRQLPEASRSRFAQLVPLSLAAAAETGHPTITAERLLALLETISRRSAYLALLQEHSPLLPRLAHILSSAAWAAEYLCRHPILLDELLDARLLFEPPDVGEWRKQLRRELDAVEADTERRMDVLRHFQHSQTFRLLAQDVTGQLTVERLADYLSALADLILSEALVECWREMPVRHVESPRFAIVGYGKLGGKELGYASDLDLVFLYDDDDESAPMRYTRLAQRLIAWLTSLTGAGRLYEVDARLRPDGEAGLLVTSVPSFERYQRDKAWTWEHQALTRARFVAGDAAIGAEFESLRTAILRTPRDPGRLAAEIVAMRAKMHEGHPNPSAQFDVKHDPGGMVDIEFVVQFLVLAHSHAHEALTRNLGNIALLRIAGELGLVDAALAREVADAYRTYRRAQHKLRLEGHSQARVEPDSIDAERRRVEILWNAVLGGATPAADDGTIGPPSRFARYDIVSTIDKQ